MQSINKIIFDYEQKKQKAKAEATANEGAQSSGVPDGQLVDAASTGKLVTFRATAKAEKLVKEPKDAPDRGLSSYLALPLDQYSLLDPGWISRQAGTTDRFLLRLPLFDMVGLDLQPQLSIQVVLDTRNSQVNFYADKFKLGDARFDADFKLDMRASLHHRPVGRFRSLPRRLRRIWRNRPGRGGGQAGHVLEQEQGEVDQQSLPTAAASSAGAAGSLLLEGGASIPAGYGDGLHEEERRRQRQELLPPSVELQQELRAGRPAAWPIAGGSSNGNGGSSGNGAGAASASRAAASSGAGQPAGERAFIVRDDATSSYDRYAEPGPESDRQVVGLADSSTSAVSRSTATASLASSTSSSGSSSSSVVAASYGRGSIGGATAVTVAPSGEGGASSGTEGVEGATALLLGHVDLGVSVMLPPPLSAVPRPLLSMTASLVARLAMQSLLPSFLDLLLVDYGRWSSGQSMTARASQPAGDLAKAAAAKAALVSPEVLKPEATADGLQQQQQPSEEEGGGDAAQAHGAQASQGPVNGVAEQQANGVPSATTGQQGPTGHAAQQDAQRKQ